MAHHPTFRKIYCDAVPYLFKKVRLRSWALPLTWARAGLRPLALPCRPGPWRERPPQVPSCRLPLRSVLSTQKAVGLRRG